MTVINAMKFNEQEGGMVADSQSSTQVRKYEFADKVVPIKCTNTVALVGGAGVADFLYEASSSLLSYANEHQELDIRSLAKVLSEITLKMKREKIDQYLRSQFGVDSQGALTGQIIVDGKPISIDPQLKGPITEVFTVQGRYATELFHGGFVIIGKDVSGTNLYQLHIGEAPFLSARPYASMGSGGDESDKILYHFIKSIKREDRNKIDPVEGMSALIKATNASSDFNQGVGGVPTISQFGAKGIITLEEDESRLATELVRAYNAQLISSEAHHNGLDALLHQKNCFEEVEKAAFKENQKYDQIMRLLRGYKD